ncbi:MAG: M20/M25/M40 family metallo-hydrolase [Chloroflexaceae bacterium]|nr:M20/M25/M40 family metallo-hydrolase [Chloroflexaceae bacterium]
MFERIDEKRWAAYIEANQPRFLDELYELLRVPSVAAQKRGITEAAALVKRRLIQLGAEVRVFSMNGGSPIICATIGNGDRRLLVYDHYDVQPEDPLDLWVSEPFEPTIRDGKLYARGVADNKGNLMLRLQTVEAWLATQGDLPISLVFLIEGEEEVSSHSLPTFCRTHADLIKADGCLWETGYINIDEYPVITCGAKGIQNVELVAHGARIDQHSSIATIVPNPAWRLTWALASLKGPDERILIPGHYDAVRPPSAADMAALERIPANDDILLADLGISSFLLDVSGWERLRRHLFEPTCTICGLTSGYSGEGFKTVLPNTARAKLDFRLVPDMRPSTVLQNLRQHLSDEGFGDIEVIDLGGEYPSRSDIESPIAQAMVAAAEATYHRPAVLYPTMAGSGPMYVVGEERGIPIASGAGCGYYGMQIHAPNEHIRLKDYWLAMDWMARFIAAFGA